MAFEPICYADTDSLKYAKRAINAIYGKEVTKIMNTRDYIVIHRGDNTGIVFTDRIEAIMEQEDGTTSLIVSGYPFYSDNKYTDIVKKLLK